MPRQSRGGRSAPARAPASAPARHASTSSVPATQQRPHPPAVAHPPPSQGPGMFGNMMSTAAGVGIGSAIGHTIGHGLTGMFGGSSSAAEPAEQAQAPMQQQAGGAFAQEQSYGGVSCDADAKAFTKCLGENDGNMQICSWYLENLKACQAAARPY